MRLLQARMVGHRRVRNSGWFFMQGRRTILAGANGTGKSALLRSLATINPPEQEVDTPLFPAEEYPQFDATEGHLRKVRPQKKTAVCVVFAAEPAFQKKLAEIDPVFFNDNRIEVGRRLDNSRWVSFLEIAASSRWSEIAEELTALRGFVEKHRLSPQLIEEYDALTRDIPATARVNNELALSLESWLVRVEGYLDAERREILSRALAGVRRADRFRVARELVEEKLPLCIYFSDSYQLRGAVHLPQLAERLAANSVDEQYDLVALCLLKLMGISAARLIKLAKMPGDLQAFFDMRRPAVEAAAASISSLVARVWQDRYRLSLFIDDDYLYIGATDKDGNAVPLAHCDPEFSWLVGLYGVLLAHAGSRHGSAVLLLDDPGLRFDPVRQQRFQRVLVAIAAQQQVIYSTHSPFLIGAGDLRRVRLLSRDETGAVTVRNKVEADALAAMFPHEDVRAAGSRKK